MGCLEGSGVLVLYIGRTVPKGQCSGSLLVLDLFCNAKTGFQLTVFFNLLAPEFGI
jgi:hypothetical protein